MSSGWSASRAWRRRSRWPSWRDARPECGDVPALAGSAGGASSQGLGHRLGRRARRSSSPRSTTWSARRPARSCSPPPAATTRLAERLLPFYGIIRADLRGLPVVILPGALYVTESALRKNTGTHYTPRSPWPRRSSRARWSRWSTTPGPLQTADTNAVDAEVGERAPDAEGRRHRDGLGRVPGRRRPLPRRRDWSTPGRARATSGAPAYLDDAAARRLGRRRADPLVIEARRQIIEHCLYGVDINPMAVEMAKLSLWLVSMDPERPFTFLDDRLVAGDSLLGITSVEQLEAMHMDPGHGGGGARGCRGRWTSRRSGCRTRPSWRRGSKRCRRTTSAWYGTRLTCWRRRKALGGRQRLAADAVVGAALAAEGISDEAASEIPGRRTRAVPGARRVPGRQGDAKSGPTREAGSVAGGRDRRWGTVRGRGGCVGRGSVGGGWPKGSFGGGTPLHLPLEFPGGYGRERQRV